MAVRQFETQNLQFLGQGVRILNQKFGRVPTGRAHVLVLGIGRGDDKSEIVRCAAFGAHQDVVVARHLRRIPRFGDGRCDFPAGDDRVVEVVAVGPLHWPKARDRNRDGNDFTQHVISPLSLVVA